MFIGNSTQFEKIMKLRVQGIFQGMFIIITQYVIKILIRGHPKFKKMGLKTYYKTGPDISSIFYKN